MKGKGSGLALQKAFNILSFNFNKKKELGMKQVHIGDKLLYEAVL